MAIIGYFGKLASTVTPDKGERINLIWDTSTDIAPDLLTQVATLSVPGTPNTKTYYINKILLTGPTTYYAEVKKNSIVVWRGRASAGNVDIHRDLTDAELTGAPGDTFEVWLEHWARTGHQFSGALMGFRR